MDDLEITDTQKDIYNLYLKWQAFYADRPYTKRKNFDNLSIENKKDLIKLSLFFERNPEINKDLLFKAGFEYNKNTFLNLSYFYNLNVLKDYKKLEEKQYNKSVDSEEIINDFKNGILFILSFLKEKNCKNFLDYINLKNENGIQYALIHLKQHKISFYHLHLFDFSIKNQSEEILNIFLNDFTKKFYETRRQYILSTKLKQIGNKLTNKQ